MDQVKISVLSSGQALLDGREVTLSELEEALQAARLNGSPIQYYREDPESEAPAEAEAVLFPDRSPRPSNVIEWPVIETFFANVRKQAASSRGVSLVRQDRLHFILPAPPLWWVTTRSGE